MQQNIWRGVERSQAWPRKRGKSLHPATRAQMEWFRQANEAFKRMDAKVQDAYRQMTAGSSLMPRDLWLMTQAGNFAYFVDPDGTRHFAMSTVQGVSESLDAISALEGQILIRGNQFWEGLTLEGLIFPPWYYEPPLAAEFTLVNSDGTNLTLTDDPNEGLQADCGAVGAGVRSRMAFQTIPVPTSDWEYTAQINIMCPNLDFTDVGMFLRDTITGRMLSLARVCLTAYPGAAINVNRWSALNTYNSNSATFSSAGPVPTWLRMARIGSSIWSFISENGVQWKALNNQTIAGYLTNAPNQIGVGCVYNRTTGLQAQFACTHWTA